MSRYPLKKILSTFSTKDGSKRTVFSLSPVGGVSSSMIIMFIIAMPFIEFALIFNPWIFKYLGIAQSVVVFIIALSLVMFLTFLLILNMKKKVIKKIESSWNYYFKHVDVSMVLSSTITPYSDFFKLYKPLHVKNLSEEELHLELMRNFTLMQEGNRELLEAMQRDKA